MIERNVIGEKVGTGVPLSGSHSAYLEMDNFGRLIGVEVITPSPELRAALQWLASNNRWSGRESQEDAPCAPELLCAHGALSSCVSGCSSFTVRAMDSPASNLGATIWVVNPDGIVVACLISEIWVTSAAGPGPDSLGSLPRCSRHWSSATASPGL